MWTEREKIITDVNKIKTYINEMDSFHDFHLGTLEFDSEKSILKINLESYCEPKNDDGYIWNFQLENINILSFSLDAYLNSYVDEIEISDKKINFSLTNGEIIVSARNIKLGIPKKL